MSRCAPRPGAGEIFLSAPFDGHPPRLLPLERSELNDRLRFSELFVEAGEVEVEIGFGKGRSVIAAAQKQPERCWLGIELSIPYVRVAAKRAAKRKLRNLRLLRAEASEVLAALPPASLAGLHIFFPDPWPKKRHHKRRIIQPAFLDTAHRVIKAGGRFRIATDHEGYFRSMLSVFSGRPGRWTDMTRAWDDHVSTNYEVKYEAENRPIYRLAYHRT